MIDMGYSKSRTLSENDKRIIRKQRRLRIEHKINDISDQHTQDVIKEIWDYLTKTDDD